VWDVAYYFCQPTGRGQRLEEVMENFADSMQRPFKIQSGENNSEMLRQEPRTPRCEAYRFDCFEASLRLGALLQRGERVRVQDLPFKMLVVLLERPGELVSKEELARRLWGQNIFTEIDQSLYVMAGKLRQVLGDLVNSAMLPIVRAAIFIQKNDPVSALQALDSRDFDLCACMLLAPG
jgi:DNA-binding response OmpR family regulator